MSRILILGFLIFMWTSINAQDCFYPQDGDTLFTTTNTALYSDTTGFITFGEDSSGFWSISTLTPPTGTASGTFSDNEGRTSTIKISGVGQLTIKNVVSDLATPFPFDKDSCEQTFELVDYQPNVVINPPISGPCPLNIVVVLDESASIKANNSTQNVRDAVLALATGLEADTAAHQMAIVEFETFAKNVNVTGGGIGLQLLDAAYLSDLDTYLTTGYDPPMMNSSTLTGGTNWEDALGKADLITGANLILIITDGRPTFYSVNGIPMGIAGEGLVYDLTALKQAQDVANIIKNKGKHIFVVGIDFPAEFQPLKDISGNVQYFDGAPINTLLSSDFTLVNPTDLVSVLTQASQFCLPIVVPQPVPTIGEWATISLSLLMMILGVVATRKESDTVV